MNGNRKNSKVKVEAQSKIKREFYDKLGKRLGNIFSQESINEAKQKYPKTLKGV